MKSVLYTETTLILIKHPGIIAQLKKKIKPHYFLQQDVKSPIPVRHFQYMTWPVDDEKPASSNGILQLISAVENWQKSLKAPGPIVVMCM